MAAMALLGELCRGATIVRSVVNRQMQRIAASETRQRAIDRSQRADAGIEHEHARGSQSR